MPKIFLLFLFVFFANAILQAQSHSKKENVQIVSAEIVKDTILIWSTINEPADTTIIFNIEQFRWNKWVKVNSFNSQKKDGNYSCVVSHHPGKNKYRISSALAIYSMIVEYIVHDNSQPMGPLKVGNYLELEKEEAFEIYDQNGEVKLKGTAKKIDASKLPKGVYYMNTSSRTSEFIKK